MNLFSKPKSVVTRQEFIDRFSETLIVVGDVGPRPRGGQRKTVMGTRKAQLTKAIVCEIATMLVEKMAEDREVFEPAAQDFYDQRFRSEWAKKRAAQMAQIRHNVKDVDEFSAANKLMGPLITLRSSPQSKPRETVRIATASATPGELYIFAAALMDRGKNMNKMCNDSAQIIRRAADKMDPNERWDEALARHAEAVRQGGR